MSQFNRNLVWTAGLLALAGCPNASQDEVRIDSETHFLRACDSSCPEGLECICGVCSVTCNPASDCSAIHEGASCVSAESFGGSMCESGADPSVCDVECAGDPDCADLGDDHRCVEGRCRAEAVPTDGCLYYGEPYRVGDEFDARDGCNSCRCESSGEILCTARECGLAGCEYDGRTYQPGDQFPADDGCNTCSCDESGDVFCTLIACVSTCDYDGRTYSVGERFPASDGCNTCTCEADGEVACTEEDCDVCDLPFVGGPCEAAISVYWHNPDTGLCEPATYGGCEGNANRFATLQACAQTCSGAQNGGGVGASCRVKGEDYAHWDELPSPYDFCNTCVCYDGEIISCTNADCAGDACPAGTNWGTGCAVCGAPGGCDVYETACLPRCDAGQACPTGQACMDGVCEALCF